jgi:hypothetical protein
MVSLEFFIDVILPAALWLLGLTQPLTEMSKEKVKVKVTLEQATKAQMGKKMCSSTLP